MTERPILFSGPMVRALLEGRKTQTRRVIKPQPKVSADEAAVLPQAWEAGFVNVKCPYGVPGDRLWVRETFYCDDYRYPDGPVDELKTALEYRASHNCSSWETGCPCNAEDRSHWKPSIFMPRWASRITLEITGVRAERLQDISEEDAIAEGCNPDDPITDEELESLPTDLLELQSHLGSGHFTAKFNFMMLWDSINGKKRPWASNPWVWVISLRMLDDKGRQ